MARATVLKQLDRVLAEEDDEKFLEQLANLDQRFNDVDVAKRPEPLNKFGILWALYLPVKMEGIWQYLADSEGDDFQDALRCCREVGAARAVAYLEAVAALFPRGRISQERDKRFNVVEKLEKKALAANKRDPLRLLDKEYADAMPALARTVRAWITSNRAKLESVLESLHPPEPPAPDPFEDVLGVESWVASMEKLFATAAAPAERARLRERALKAGLIPWRSTANDAKLATFVERARKLTRADWKEVALRYFNHRRTLDAVQDASFKMRMELEAGDLVDAQVYEDAFTRAVDMMKPVYALVHKLPTRVSIKRKPVPVRTHAHQATEAVAGAIWLREWLELLPNGNAAANSALARFEDLISHPATSGARRR